MKGEFLSIKLSIIEFGLTFFAVFNTEKDLEKIVSRYACSASDTSREKPV